MPESVQPEEFRDELAHVGVELGAGTVTGVANTDPINLNALAVGLGLENTEYEPDHHEGVIYRPDVDATVVLFRDGTVVTVDAADEETAEDAIRTTIEQTSRLGLVASSEPAAITVPAGELSLPPQRT